MSQDKHDYMYEQLVYNFTYYDQCTMNILYSPVYVNINFLPCPLGFVLRGIPSKCKCSNILQNLPGMKCLIQDQTITRSGLVWVGAVVIDGEKTIGASANCPYHYSNYRNVSITVDDFDSQCMYNHAGTLCGRCQSNLSLALGTSQCLQCSNVYLVLLVPFALAGAVLVFSLKVFDLTTSEGTINGLVYYANIIKATDYVFLPAKETNPLTLFIAWLNFDLGVETCFFAGLDAYWKTWLQFVFPAYIWFLAGLIIISAKYSNRVAKTMGNNSVPVLATLFLLSHAKLIRTIIVALSYTMIAHPHGQKAVWSADGNLDYLGPRHAVLFTAALVMLVFFWFPHTFILLCGQWLHRCKSDIIVRMLIKLKPFLDAHYGPLKGQHRYWFGAQLLLRGLILLLSAIIPSTSSNIVILTISVSSILLVSLSFVGVYHNKTVSYFELSFFTNLAILSVAMLYIDKEGGNQTAVSYTLIAIALAQFFGLFVLKIFSVYRLRDRVYTCVCLRRREEVVQDCELYDRDEESESGENKRGDSEGSLESLPTY